MVIASYAVALQLRPGHRWLAGLAAALTAFNPQFLFFSASVNNDNLINPLGGIILALLLYGLDGQLGWRYPVMLGFLTGLAILSKPGGLAAIVLVAVALIWLAWRNRSCWQLIRDICLFALPAAAVSGWWFTRNLQVYGEPLALVAHKVFGERFPKVGPVDLLTSEGEGLWRSYWGVFGGFNVLGPPWTYVFFDALAIVAALGLLLGTARAFRRGTYSAWFDVQGANAPAALRLGLMILWLTLLAGALVNWSLTVSASQGRLLFPAMASGSTLMALGLWQYPLPRKLLVGAITLTLLGIAAAIPLTVISPAYAQPPLVDARQLGEIPNPVRVNFDDRMELLGYALDSNEVRPGGRLGLTLYWRVLNKMQRDYSIYIHLLDPRNEPIGQDNSYPGGGAYRTSELCPGQAFTYTHSLTVSPQAEAPALGHIHVGLYDIETMEQLPAYDGQMNRIHAAPAGTFRIRPKSPQNCEPENMVSAHFDQQIELIGYDLPAGQLAPDQVLTGHLCWRALKAPDKDYTVFVQMLGPTGLVAQYDAQPRQGGYPTSAWEAGETIEDTFELRIPSDVDSGEYLLIAGLYDVASGKRLRMGSGDYVTLGAVKIR